MSPRYESTRLIDDGAKLFLSKFVLVCGIGFEAKERQQTICNSVNRPYEWHGEFHERQQNNTRWEGHFFRVDSGNRFRGDLSKDENDDRQKNGGYSNTRIAIKSNRHNGGNGRAQYID